MNGVIVATSQFSSSGSIYGEGIITGRLDSSGIMAPGVDRTTGAQHTSIATLTVDGNYIQTSPATLSIEIAGQQPTYGIDALVVTGNATLDGTLIVSLIENYTLGLNKQFMILEVGGIHTGQFIGLDEGAPVGTYNGTDLYITYAGGDGNDVVLYTVPEPAVLVVVLLGMLAMRRRRRTPSPL